jgi:hypothetical protein
MYVQLLSDTLIGQNVIDPGNLGTVETPLILSMPVKISKPEGEIEQNIKA